MGSNGDPSFQNFLAEKLITNLVKVNIIPEDTKNREYIWTFLYSSMFNLLTVWRKNDHDLSEEEFVKMMFTLASKGLEGYAMFQAGNNEKSR